MSAEITNIQLITTEVKQLIAQSRQNVALTVNAEMSILYWQIGKRIHQETLKEKRAEYGKQVVSTLSQHLVTEYGDSFSEKNLRRMVQFATTFPERL